MIDIETLSELRRACEGITYPFGGDDAWLPHCGLAPEVANALILRALLALMDTAAEQSSVLALLEERPSL